MRDSKSPVLPLDDLPKYIPHRETLPLLLLVGKEFKDGELERERGDGRVANALGGIKECKHGHMSDVGRRTSHILFGELFEGGEFVRAELVCERGAELGRVADEEGGAERL